MYGGKGKVTIEQLCSPGELLQIVGRVPPNPLAYMYTRDYEEKVGLSERSWQKVSPRLLSLSKLRFGLPPEVDQFSPLDYR